MKKLTLARYGKNKLVLAIAGKPTYIIKSEFGELDQEDEKLLAIMRDLFNDELNKIELRSCLLHHLPNIAKMLEIV
jgi:hypothetical protein